MRRNIISNVVVPLLFVTIGSLVALYIVYIVRHTKPEAGRSTQTKHIEEPSNDYLISEYDQIFKEVGEKYELDWLLLAAIAHTESKFCADAKSPVGARGLMQVMPHVANNMGYEQKEELYDAKTNVEVAAQLLIENKKMLHLPTNFDKAEELNFLLACYNAGYSRIDDARDVARYYEADADKWSIVSLFLSWFSDPEFWSLDTVESGPFYGSQETLDYVEKVTDIYNSYRKRYQETKSEAPKDTSLKHLSR